MFERLGTPYLLLSAMQYLAFGQTSDMSDREKKLVGSHGLSVLAPVGALREFASGKIATPPLVDAVMSGVVRPVLEGDSPKLERGLDSMHYSYAPGTGLLRFITDDLVTYATGNHPQGKSFIERTDSGINQIIK